MGEKGGGEGGEEGGGEGRKRGIEVRVNQIGSLCGLGIPGLSCSLQRQWGSRLPVSV